MSTSVAYLDEMARLYKVEAKQRLYEKALERALRTLEFITNDKYVRYEHFKHIDEQVFEVIDACLDDINKILKEEDK